MDQNVETPQGAIWRLLADDHARLDSLLERAGSCSSVEELASNSSKPSRRTLKWPDTRERWPPVFRDADTM